MGSLCNEEQLKGKVDAFLMNAGVEVPGANIMKESTEFQTGYEFHYASQKGLHPNAPKVSAMDVLQPRKRNLMRELGANIIDHKLYGHPTEMYPKFYKMVEADVKADGVYKAGNKYIKLLKETIESGNETASLGLHRDQLEDAYNWVTWLSKGGHGATESSKVLGNLSKAQANLNMVWTLGNVTDMTRVVSQAITRPGGAKAFIKGFGDMLAATKGNPFRQVESLKTKGVYQSVHLDRGGSNKFNPFEWAITAQKNMAYHIGESLPGTNGKAFMRDALFEYSPLDAPRHERYENSDLIFGLARYPINEARWYSRTVKSALMGDKREAVNLVVHTLLRGALIGIPSLVPFPVWQAMPEEYKEAFKAADERFSPRIIRNASMAAFKAIGMDMYVDLTDYTQPFGGGLGAKFDTAKAGFQRVGDLFTAGAELSIGKADAAAAHAAAGTLALLNLFGPIGKLQKLKPLLDPINSVTVTKLMDTVGDALSEEFGVDKFKKEIARDVLTRNVKVDKNAKKRRRRRHLSH